MLEEIAGDLITVGQGIIAHQTNYDGVMGGGVAYSIRQKLLSDWDYKQYQDYCAKYGPALLGTNQYFCCSFDVWVANMFCQNDFTGVTGCLTNYEAMRRCLEHLRSVAHIFGRPIYLPGRIGCGIAGGDWTRVKALIEEVMDGVETPVTIVYWDKEVR